MMAPAVAAEPAPTACVEMREIWHARCPVPTPLNLAVQLGWVAQVLLQRGNVALRSLPETSDPVEPVQYHESTLPNSFRQGGSVPAIWARASGQQTRVVGLSWTDEFQAIIAMPHVAIGGIRELRGRRIGVPRHAVTIDHSRAAALRAFSAVLATERMTFDDVELIDLPDHAIPSVTRDGAVLATGSGRRGRYRYTSEIHALARGDVDAVYVKDVHGAQATHLLGATVISNVGFHPDASVRINNCTPRPLTVSQFLLDQYPDLVRELLTQVVLAGAWARAHREATLTLLARETGCTENWVHHGYGEDVHRNLGLTLSPSWVAGIDTFKNFLVNHGFLTGDFDVEDWIDPAPLRDVTERLYRDNPAALAFLGNQPGPSEPRLLH
jgi:ABC-type nitrate/sulfonate/bicarbonate transport system substrate-binding protein